MVRLGNSGGRKRRKPLAGGVARGFRLGAVEIVGDESDGEDGGAEREPEEDGHSAIRSA
jgi:hypothetical protein